MKEIKINVKGMHCIGCENRIINSLKLIDGVDNVLASYSDGIVLVTLNQDIDLKIIKEQIIDLGFEVIDEKNNS